MKWRRSHPAQQYRAQNAVARALGVPRAATFAVAPLGITPSRVHDSERFAQCKCLSSRRAGSRRKNISKTIILLKSHQALGPARETTRRTAGRGARWAPPPRFFAEQLCCRMPMTLPRHLAHIRRTRPQQPAPPLLLARMRGPAGGARRREDRGERLARDLPR